ncbi:MAG: hypothetical protein HY040_12060 [Planctomycetes bacterium]|nr:hypothetical protein [Planctomycetota bacterium]
MSKWPSKRRGKLDGTICYLNTDLDLISPNDLTALAAAFDSRHVFALHVIRGEDGFWHATFETGDSHAEPELNIAAMVAVIESFGKRHRTVWQHCTQREFNIGYDCGTEPWAFSQGLSCGLLARMAAIGASLRFTLYPHPSPASPSATTA